MGLVCEEGWDGEVEGVGKGKERGRKGEGKGKERGKKERKKERWLGLRGGSVG